MQFHQLRMISFIPHTLHRVSPEFITGLHQWIVEKSVCRVLGSDILVTN